MNLKSIVDNRYINIKCEDCDYTFKFKYSELKPNPILVFCPICHKEKQLCSKNELTSFLEGILDQLA